MTNLIYLFIINSVPRLLVSNNLLGSTILNHFTLILKLWMRGGHKEYSTGFHPIDATVAIFPQKITPDYQVQ